jgi:hypothetical protein
MIVTQGIHGDAGQGIEVRLALLIENTTAFAVSEGDRQPPVSVHQMRHE